MFITSLISRPPSPWWEIALGQHRLRHSERLGEGTREVGIGAVARSHRHHMAADRATEQREIANDIEDLVPHELVGKSERFLA